MPISHLLGESMYCSSNGSHPQNQNVEDITDLTGALIIEHKLHHHDHQFEYGSALPLSPHSSSGYGEKFVLIDTDAGSEDAWALFMSLAAHRSHPDFKIEGITTVYGNAVVDQVANNVTRTLNVLHETSIPIYKGMDSPMVDKMPAIQRHHGHDGFGDCNFPSIPSRIEPGHGVEAIIKFAENYAGKLTILCMGPLSNLAMAVKLRPDLKTKVKEIFILGGNFEGIGNATVSSEFNFFADPEAAQVVLDNFGGTCAINILPWETCIKFGALSHEWRKTVLGTMRTAEMDVLNKIDAKILSTYSNNWLVPDALLAACFIDPSIITASQAFHCSVELTGRQTRGMLIVDKTFMHQKQSNATFILEIDQEILEKMLVWAAGGPMYGTHN